MLIWIYLIAFRGGFWRISTSMASQEPANAPAKRIQVVIPARNEAAGIAETISSLLSQRFPGPIEITLIDDGSTDGTADLASAAAERVGRASQLTILRAEPPAPGWTGKLWALSHGVAHASARAPDYFLFTDADIRHGPESIATLVGTAEAGPYDLASFMVKLKCVTMAEKALIPAFVYFFLQLYPPSWIQSPNSKTAGAAGGCILIRPSALAGIGGIAAIRGEVIDDCALARAVKRTGGRVWMGLTAKTQSMRSYGSYSEIGRMISRTAFNELGHSTLLLIVTLVALFLTYLLPVILLFTGSFRCIVLGATAWLLMAATYLPVVRFYRRSPFWAMALPLVTLFYAGATMHSAAQYWRGRGGEWKGRIQDAHFP